MAIISVTNARKDLYQLINQVNQNSEPLIITGKHSNAVLIGEEDWKSIQETLYLESIPGMHESLISARDEPLEEGITELPW